MGYFDAFSAAAPGQHSQKLPGITRKRLNASMFLKYAAIVG